MVLLKSSGDEAWHVVNTGSEGPLLLVMVCHRSMEHSTGFRSEGRLSSWAGKTWGANNQMCL